MECWQKYVSLCQQGPDASCCVVYLNACYISTSFQGRHNIPLTANATNSQYYVFSLYPSSLLDILRDPHGECTALNNWITVEKDLSVMSRCVCVTVAMCPGAVYFYWGVRQKRSVPVDVDRFSFTNSVKKCREWNTIFGQLLCYLSSSCL